MQERPLHAEGVVMVSLIATREPDLLSAEALRVIESGELESADAQQRPLRARAGFLPENFRTAVMTGQQRQFSSKFATGN